MQLIWLHVHGLKISLMINNTVAAVMKLLVGNIIAYLSVKTKYAVD